MKILAYDTSGDALTVALADGPSLVAELEAPPSARHGASLVPTIQALFKKNRTNWDDIDVIAVGLGPGSFTGLRVGLTTAKLFGYTLKKKIVGVSSLEAIAAASEGDGSVAALVDARRGEVYAALFEKKEDRLIVRSKPAAARVERLLKSIKKPVRFAGPGAVLYRREIESLGGRFVTIGSLEGPRAAWVARLGFESAKRKKFIDPFKLEPLYLRPRDCNVTLKP